MFNFKYNPVCFLTRFFGVPGNLLRAARSWFMTIEAMNLRYIFRQLKPIELDKAAFLAFAAGTRVDAACALAFFAAFSEGDAFKLNV
ncbi:hypothetical protein Tco_1251634 [Tanacetum coccineum]